MSTQIHWEEGQTHTLPLLLASLTLITTTAHLPRNPGLATSSSPLSSVPSGQDLFLNYVPSPPTHTHYFSSTTHCFICPITLVAEDVQSLSAFIPLVFVLVQIPSSSWTQGLLDGDYISHHSSQLAEPCDHTVRHSVRPECKSQLCDIAV